MRCLFWTFSLLAALLAASARAAAADDAPPFDAQVRPVLEAADPRVAAESIVAEIAQALA